MREWQLFGVALAAGVGAAWTLHDAIAGSVPAMMSTGLLLAIPLGVVIEARDLRRQGLGDRVGYMIRLTLQTAVFAMALAMLGQMRVDDERASCSTSETP